MHQESRVASVVQDHVGASPVRSGCLCFCAPVEDALGAPPVLLEALPLPGEDGHAGRLLDAAGWPDGDSRGRFILRRKNVATRPAHLCAKGDESFDQHSGLHRHVQRACDASSGQRLGLAELCAQSHQPRHLMLGKPDLVTPGFGERKVGNFEGEGQCVCENHLPILSRWRTARAPGEEALVRSG